MKRPNKRDYISGNQVFYSEELQKYHEDLEKYVNHLEVKGMQAIDDICENDKPWPLQDVLQKLVWATNYLLHRKNYDGHNHEELKEAAKRGVEMHKSLIEKLKISLVCVNCGSPMYDSFSGTHHNSETCQNQRPATAQSFENA